MISIQLSHFLWSDQWCNKKRSSSQTNELFLDTVLDDDIAVSFFQFIQGLLFCAIEQGIDHVLKPRTWDAAEKYREDSTASECIQGNGQYQAFQINRDVARECWERNMYPIEIFMDAEESNLSQCNYIFHHFVMRENKMNSNVHTSQVLSCH